MLYDYGSYQRLIRHQEVHIPNSQERKKCTCIWIALAFSVILVTAFSLLKWVDSAPEKKLSAIGPNEFPCDSSPLGVFNNFDVFRCQKYCRINECAYCVSPSSRIHQYLFLEEAFDRLRRISYNVPSPSLLSNLEKDFYFFVSEELSNYASTYAKLNSQSYNETDGGFIFLMFKTVRSVRSRSPIHKHSHGGRTCVLSGEMTLYFVDDSAGGGHTGQLAKAGSCYEMMPNRSMTGVNTGSTEAVMLDQFLVPMIDSSHIDPIWTVTENVTEATNQFDVTL